MSKKIFNTYFFIARLFPTVIISVPLLILLWRVDKISNLHEIFTYLSKIEIIANVTFTIILWYALTLIVRFPARKIEDEIFIKLDGFPSTYLMLYSNGTYTKQYKDKFRKSIENKFKYKLLNKKSEIKNINRAKKSLDEAMGLVREATRGDEMLLKYNSWYGFYRNLTGGILYTIMFCFCNLFIFGSILQINSIYYFHLSILILCTVYLLFGKRFLIMSGEDYAKQLHRIFMQ